MSNVAEFISIREQIESHAKEIAELLEQNTIQRGKTLLDDASRLLTILTDMADNDVQVTAVGRLTRLLNNLRVKMIAAEAKQRSPKKPRAAR
jgi:hypothetical protein